MVTHVTHYIEKEAIMRYYKFYNGFRDVKVYVRDGWCQFHSMCAQCRNYHTDFNRNGDKEYIVHDFVSYDTPICRVWIEKGGQTYWFTVSDMFNHSKSTIHQFSRWLRELQLPLSYLDIKQLSQYDMAGSPDICSPIGYDSKHARLSFCTVDYLANLIGW